MIESPLNCVVGKRYWVPCVYWLQEVRGFTPIIGGLHEDREHIGVSEWHYHIDHRFVPDYVWRHWQEKPALNLGKIIMSVDIGGSTHAVRIRRLKCRREMPVFPLHYQLTSDSKPMPITFIARLEDAYEGQCLKACAVCPHRGFSLDVMKPDADGNVTCPGHGLTWNLQTRKLVRRTPGGARC